MTVAEPTRFSRTARAPAGRRLGRHQSVRSHVWIPESYRQRTSCKMSSGTPLVNEQQVYRRRDLEGLPSEHQRRWSAAQPVHGPRYTGLHQLPHRVSTVQSGASCSLLLDVRQSETTGTLRVALGSLCAELSPCSLTTRTQSLLGRDQGPNLSVDQL